jgi:TolB protein
MRTVGVHIPVIAVLFLAALFGVGRGSIPAEAQTTIVISDPGRRFPIALPQLCMRSGESPAAQSIPSIIAKDLDLSGYFDIISPNAYIEAAGKCVAPDSKSYSDWNMIRAQWLVRGTTEADGSQIRVVLELHDVPSQRRILGKEYTGSMNDVRRIAHKFANEIMKEVTGEYGPFGTQIAFTGKIGRFKDIFVMDLDGENLRQVTTDKGLALAPAWDRTGRTILFTSYRTREPNLYLLDVLTSRTRALTRGSALKIGGAFTADGSRIVSSLTENRDSDLVAYSLNGDLVQRLTPANQAIDVSPTFSPDGKQMAFCSDRGGRPQIYVMSSDGGAAHRVSFVSSDYCTSPSWAPKGDRLAFVCRGDGGFQIYLSNTDGSNPIQLTSGGDNEDPDWSPDGRYLIFSSTFGKRGGVSNLAIMRASKNLEGTAMKQVSFGRGNDGEPSWGPYPQ